MASTGVLVVQQGQECARKDGELVGLNPGAATALPLVPHNPGRSLLSPGPGSDSLSEARLGVHCQGPGL